MLSAYLDDSGTHPESSVSVVAAVVAPPRQWEKLTREWVTTLEKFNVPAFHASDCANGGDVFMGWEVEQRNALFARLTKIASRYVAFRTWTAIPMEDYRITFKPTRKETLPVSICAMGCASRLKQLALKREIYIDYVFDQAPKAGRIFQAFEDLKRKRRSDFYRMGMLSKGDRVKRPPLQAADLVAYETYRYFSDQLAGWYKPRSWFTDLLHIEDLSGYFMKANHLRTLAAGAKKGDEENSEEPIMGIPLERLSFSRLLRVSRNKAARDE